MRDDKNASASSNGFVPFSNGSPPNSGRKSAKVSVMNGHSTSTSHTNGANGTKKLPSPVRSPTYRGHNREEVTRILIQGLADLGYENAAASLSQESGFDLESPAVAAFRTAVLEGQWVDAEDILLGSNLEGMQPARFDHADGHHDGLVLAEGADQNQMLFWLRQQKFLELLEQRELGLALMVLRQELTPLNHDVNQLHALSR